MAAALEGCFFWERTTYYEGGTNDTVAGIRAAQRKFFVPKKKPEKVYPALGVKPMSAGEIEKKDIDEILAMVLRSICLVHGVTANDIARQTPRKECAAAKAHYYWALKRYMPWLSIAEIGRQIGKNHSTILHGLKVFDKIRHENVGKIQAVDGIMGFKSSAEDSIIKT